MKFAQLNRVAHLQIFFLMVGFVIMSVSQALSLESMIAFCSDRAKHGGNRDILLMKTDGAEPRNLTADPMSDDYAPAWSPDGTKIAYSSERLGNLEIYVMDDDGENLVQLTRHRAYDAPPSWSPDGAKIAFVSERDNRENFEIYVMNANGKNPVRLTRNPGWDVDPSWSRAGTKIAFESRRNETMDIYTIEPDGRNLVRLTKDPAVDKSPSWSPNGRKIAYSSKRNDNYEIYVMDADGGNPTNLTRNLALDRAPAWSPLQLAVSPKARLLMLWGTIKTSR